MKKELTVQLNLIRKKMKTLNENLETNDLKRLVNPELHIDQYKSKMGDDADVCVVSFKVTGKEPANDVVAFFEKGYDWVLDADVSAGEQEDGDYLVFVEVARNKDTAKNILKLLEDLMNLTEQKEDEWNFTYYKSSDKHPVTIENLEAVVPLSKEEYLRQTDNREIDQLKTAAGVEVTTKAPVNDFTESLRVAAGIK